MLAASSAQAASEYGGLNLLRETVRAITRLSAEHALYLIGGAIAIVLVWGYLRR